MAEVGQGRFFHGYILTDFMRAMDIPLTKENKDAVKEIFKKYLSCPSTSALDTKNYERFSSACAMLMAREFGIEVPESRAQTTMENLLKQISNGI